MIKKVIKGLPILVYEHIDRFSDVSHFVSTRRGGVSCGDFDSLNLSYSVNDDADSVKKNRLLLADSMGLNADRLLFPKQVHGDKVFLVNSKTDFAHSSELLYGVDAMITKDPGVCLCIKAADCVPILFYDPEHRAIGVAHAGWRGTVARIAVKTIKAMKEHFGTSYSDVLIGIGPSIGPKHYEVGEELITDVKKTFSFSAEIITTNAEGKFCFDLWKANMLQLFKQGVPKDNIQVAGLCTWENYNDFYSHRRSGGKTGRFATGIFLKR